MAFLKSSSSNSGLGSPSKSGVSSFWYSGREKELLLRRPSKSWKDLKVNEGFRGFITEPSHCQRGHPETEVILNKNMTNIKWVALNGVLVLRLYRFGNPDQEFEEL
jgi:hypothetical protein